MAEIVPAIMPKDYADLQTKVGQVVSAVQSVQIDIMDGVFVPGQTWPFANPADTDFSALVKGDKGLPFWENVDYEFDLMIANPEEYISDFVALGASRIVIHLESLDDPLASLEHISDRYGKGAGVIELLLAIGVQTHLDALAPLIPLISGLQMMGIAEIGKQGEPFVEEVVERVQQIKERYPELLVSVDGGVNDEYAGALVEAGADRLVSGSFIFAAEDPVAQIEQLAHA